MLKKNLSKTGTTCRVTFKYENEEDAEMAILAGDFNNWSLHATPMKKLKDGSFSATLSLKTNQSYQFRYVLNGEVWVNDRQADGYMINDFGEMNAVLAL